jgi:hypothetical protein
MAIPLTTRELDPEHEWAFFRDDLAPVSAEDRSAIVALDDASARRVWDAVVAQKIPATVVARDGWLCALSDCFDWKDAWNNRDDDWAARTLGPRLTWVTTKRCCSSNARSVRCEPASACSSAPGARSSSTTTKGRCSSA